MSKIEWTDKTWIPITGCTKITKGCQNCYAEKMHKRLQTMGNSKYSQPFNKVVCHENLLNETLKWKKPCKIFVCSMSDICHEDVPLEFIDKIMDTIRKCPQHTYQILTKRSIKMRDYFSSRTIPLNVWLGVTVENRDALVKLQIMRDLIEIQTYSYTYFVSFEPLLEDIGEIDLTGID